MAAEGRLRSRPEAGRTGTSDQDVDIEWRAEESELLDTLVDAAEHDAGDFFVFSLEHAGVPEDRLGGSHRFRVTASLAGRRFETFLLDVGLRSDDAMSTEILQTDGLLGFAGIDPVEVNAVPLELQVAEKLHAYTRRYEGGRPSTRAKDLVDLALIAELHSLDAAALRREVETIFTLRDTHIPPGALPPPPSEWAVPYRRLAEEVGAPVALEAGHRDTAALLDPVLAGKVTSGAWNPAERSWVADEGTTERGA